MGKKIRIVRTYPGAWTRKDDVQVGPDWAMPGIAQRQLPAFSDTDTIFVSKAGLDTNPGTQGKPKATIKAAIKTADEKKFQYVCVNDSGVYHEMLDFTTLCKGNPPSMFAAHGCTPTIERKIYSDVWVSDVPENDSSFVFPKLDGYTAVPCTLGAEGYVCGKKDDTGMYGLIKINGTSCSDEIFNNSISGSEIIAIADYKRSNLLAVFTRFSSIRLVDRSTGAVVKMLSIPSDLEEMPGGRAAEAYALNGVADSKRLYVSYVSWDYTSLLYYDKESETWGTFDTSDIVDVYGILEMHSTVLLDGENVFWFASCSNRSNDTLILRASLKTGTVTALCVIGQLKTAVLHQGNLIVLTQDSTLHEVSIPESGPMSSIVNTAAKNYIDANNIRGLASNGKALLYVKVAQKDQEKRFSLRLFDGKTEKQVSVPAPDINLSSVISSIFVGSEHVVLDAWGILKTTMVEGNNTFNGFTIDAHNLGCGFLSSESQATIQHCYIKNTTTAYDGAAFCSIIENATLGYWQWDGSVPFERNLVINCETGAETVNATNCTIVNCKTGIRIKNTPDEALVANNICTQNDIDIVSDGFHKIGSNVFRTSDKVVLHVGEKQIADMPLFAHPEKGDYTLRDSARGYPYDSPGISSNGDFGAYLVSRSQAKDTTELDAVFPWMPNQIQMTYNLVQMSAQDMLSGGLAVQHSGNWRSWVLSWADDNGDLAESTSWAAQLSLVADLYSKAGDGGNLFFGFTEDDGVTWGIERTCLVRAGEDDTDGKRNTIYLFGDADSLAIARDWKHRYISYEGGEPVRIASIAIDAVEKMAIIITETDIYPPGHETETHTISLLELWKVTADPRQALSLTNLYPWSSAGRTGAELMFREVPT